jgi:hypothetical protein
MKNIHVLKTSKPSRLYFDVVTKELHLQKRLSLNATSFPIEKRNIYITNDEEIKEGDWFYEPINKSILKYDSKSNKLIKAVFSGFCKKIILTTDQDLIKDGVQAIDDEFSEWFVKNPSCEKVETFHQDVYSMGKWDRRYKIIIPKEEPKQRLEKYSERFDNKDNEIVEGVFNPDTWGKRVVEEPKQELPGINEQTFKIVLKEKWFPKQETLEEVVSKQFQEDFNKEVGKVLTQELQKRESETPVEWIYRNLLENPISNQDVEYNEAVFHNAKEMEKEQERMYSEEDMFKFLDFINNRYYGSFSIDKEDLQEWFEQFKKK